MMMIRVVVVGGDDNGCDTGGGDGEDVIGVEIGMLI